MALKKPPCVNCGKLSVRDGWCKRHYPKNVTRKTASELARRYRKIKNGICLRCKEKVLPGKRYCEAHKNTYREIGKRLDTVLAMHILKRAIRAAQERRDSESIFLDPEFEEKYTEEIKEWDVK